MAYDPNVPNEANVVRGTGNDLQQMQENFSLLSGAAVKGISGLIGISADSPASGETLRFNGSNWVPSGAADDLDSLTDVTIAGPTSGQGILFDGAGWVNSGIVIPTALDDLTDVTAPGPASGESLIFDGAAWVPSGLILLSSSPRGILAFSGTAKYTVTGVSFDERVPLSSVMTSGEGLEFDTTSGVVRVIDASVGSVNILAQAGWVGPLETAAMYVTKIFKNGSGLDLDAVYKVAAESAMRGTASGGHWANQASAVNVPCVSGDEFTMIVHTDDAAGTREISGQKTWLLVEDARKGGGGGGGGFLDPVGTWLPWIPPLPVNAHIMNDEFDPDDGDGAGPGGLDSRWVEWDTAGLMVPALISGSNMLNMAYTQGSFWSGVVQTISGLGTVSGELWEVYARMHFNHDRSNASADFSLGLAAFEDAVASPTTSNFAVVLLRMTGSGQVFNFEVGEFNDRSDIPPATSGSVVHALSGLMPGCWFRIRHQIATNRFDGDVSLDGISWRNIGTRSLAWNPKELGIIGVDVFEQGTGTRARASLFRVVSGLSNRHDLVPAGKVHLERIGDNTGDSF